MKKGGYLSQKALGLLHKAAIDFIDAQKLSLSTDIELDPGMDALISSNVPRSQSRR